jgi:hypothetical protein
VEEEILGTTPYGVAVRRGGQVLFLPQTMASNASDALSAPISDPAPPAAPAPAAQPPLAAAPTDSGGTFADLANPLAGLGAPGAPASAAPAPQPTTPQSSTLADLANPLAGLGASNPAAGAPPPARTLADLANPLAGLGATPTRGPTPFTTGAPDGIVRPADVAPAPPSPALTALANPLAGLGAPPPALAAPADDGGDGNGDGGLDQGAAGAGDAPNTPYQDEQLAVLARGMLAQERAAEEAKLVEQRNVAIADAEKPVVAAQRKIDQRVEDLTSQYDAAIQARADYNAKIARAPDPNEMSAGKIIALVMFGLGSALSRDPRGVQPVLDILNARATLEAKRRVGDAERLEGLVKDRAGQLGGALKSREGLTDKLRIEKAAILEQYARDAETLGKKYEGENAFVEAQRLAAGIRKEALKDGRAAAQKQTDDEIARERIAQQERESQRRAMADRDRLDFDRKKFVVQQAFDEREISVKEGDLQLKKDQQIGERRVFGLPQIKLDQEGNPVVDAAGKPVFTRNVLTNTDGSEFRPPTKEEAVNARETIAGANKAAQLIDSLLTQIETEGWSSDTIRSPAWQKAKSTFREIQLARKGPNDLGLGVITGPDMELLNDILGGDPTGVRDPSTSLRTARNSIMLGVNTRLVGLGYDGPTFGVNELTPSAQGKPKNTPAQTLLEAAQARGEAGIAGATGVNSRLLSEEDYKASLPTSMQRVDPRALPTRSASAAIAELGRVAANQRTPPDQRQQAIESLRTLVNDPSPVVQNRVRTMAAKLRIDLQDQYNAPKPVFDDKRVPPSDGVDKDLLDSIAKAKERGTPGAAGIATGLKSLSPKDRERAIAAINDKKSEDRAENFPTARANIAIGKLIEASTKFEDPKTQEWAAYQLRQLLKDPSPIVRRRIRRAAKEKGIQIEPAGQKISIGTAEGDVSVTVRGKKVVED